MSYQKAYDISLVDNVAYPYEQYKSVINPDYFNISSRPFLFTNILRYQKRPLNEILSFLNLQILKPNSANAILYYDPITTSTYLSSNSFKDKSNSIIFYAENLNTIELNNSTTAYFNVSTLRTQYKTPQEFQIFYIQNDPNVNDCYGYLLYPNRLFLNPVKLSGNSTIGWKLSTTTNIIAWSAVFIGTTDFETEAYNIHKNYLNFTPQLCSLSNLTDPSYTLNYSICASRSRMGIKIFPNNFSSSYNPVSPFTKQFEFDTVKINPDSTFITYDASFTNPNNQKVVISQKYPYSYSSENSYDFNTSYIINFTPPSSIQTFQLIQFPKNTTLPLGSESNAILKCVIDLSTSILNYYNTGASGTYNTNITFDYIADALNINGSPAINSVNSITLDNSPYSINSNILSTTVNDNNLVWETTNPPHYYSYKTKLQSETGNYLDSFGLNFYLKTSALNTEAVDGVGYTLSLLLTSLIVSDYNALIYDLYNNTKSNEQIKYTITDISNSSAIPTLSAQYGPAGVTYDLRTSPWIPAKAGSYLKIYYPPQYGEIQFAIRASLKGDYGIHDAFEETSAVLARKYSETNNGTALTLNVLSEESNLILVDSSYNIEDIAWPSRNLQNSKISWSVNPYGSFITLYSIDTQTKRFIRFIANGEELDFDSTTQTIAVSGYGPQQTTISLSSQKYNEVASVTNNTTLFDYFKEGIFAVTPLNPLNNLNEIRNIDLKVQVPFQGKLYDIPRFLNTPIYWTWSYNDIIDPLLQPISAYEPLNNNKRYNYGTSTNYSLVSAITVKILPPTDIKPTLYSVTVTANSDVKYPPVTGSYTFNLDAFPDRGIFNSDFKTYYKNYSSIAIGDTFNGLNTITRAAGDDLAFAHVNNSALLKNTPFINKTWLLNDTNTLLSSNIQAPSSDYIIVDSNVLGLSSYKISLILNGATAQGWTSAHNVSAHEYFYAVDPVEFYKPLDFIIYPEYAWLNNSTTLTFLTTANYTLSFRPSAYGNKRSNSQTFWLSANKAIYDSYIYTNTNNSYTSSMDSPFSIMDIGYDPQDITIYTGIPITLQCYDSTKYPKIMGTQYYAPTAGSLKLLTFSNYAATREYNDNDISDFHLSPTIESYNDLQLNYTIDTPVINLDVSRNVTITQNISTIPSNTPATVIGGTITYFLSSQFWTVSSSVPAVNGTYNIFQLNYGDPVIPLFSGQEGIDRYYLYATTNVIQQIPPTTFPVNTTDYSGNTDLWSEIIL
jgi:hypothetical protein